MPESGGSAESQTAASPAPEATQDLHVAPTVFVSYASQDAAIANAVVAALERDGITCWLAPRDVRPGDFYADAIVQAITRCRVLILLLSQAAIDSPHVLREVERASSKKRPIITFRTDTAPLPPGLEYFLSASQWLDASGGPAERQFSKLISAIRSRETSSPDTEPHPGNIGGPRPRKNRTGSIAVTTIIATAFVYLVADKFWLSKRIANEQSTRTPANVSALPPSNPVSLAPGFDPPPRSIAVLPFVNMSGDAKQEYFSDGVTEELLNSLSRLNELHVVARTSSFSFKGQNVDVSTIARKLNVGAILEGSVRRNGNTVRITVQLINAVSGYHLWSQTYDRKLTDILKLQTEVATTVAQQLQGKLDGDEAAALELGDTRNTEAYDAYLRGAEIIFGNNRNRGTNFEALAAFDQAIGFDPNYAKAYAALAWVLHDIAVVAKPTDRARLRDRARIAAERAVALAPDLGEAHVALASIRAYALFDYVGAGPEFERALALAPGSAQVQTVFAWYAADLGHFDQALRAARRGVSLDPQNAYAHIVLGTVLYYARQYGSALTAFKDGQVLWPGSHDMATGVLQTLLASGRSDLARQGCESPNTPMDDDDRHYCLALAYHALGRQSDAESELAKFQALDGDKGAFFYAGVYAQWGNTRAALHWLSMAERLRDPFLWILKVDWHLDPIRNEPEFKAIVARMNFPP